MWRVYTLTPAQERPWRGRAGTGLTTLAQKGRVQRWETDNFVLKVGREEVSRGAASTSTGPGQGSTPSGPSQPPTARLQTPASPTRLCSTSGQRWVQCRGREQLRGFKRNCLLGGRGQESLHPDWRGVETCWGSDWWLCGAVLYSYTELRAWGGNR